MLTGKTADIAVLEVNFLVGHLWQHVAPYTNEGEILHAKVDHR